MCSSPGPEVLSVQGIGPLENRKLIDEETEVQFNDAPALRHSWERAILGFNPRHHDSRGQIFNSHKLEAHKGQSSAYF